MIRILIFTFLLSALNSFGQSIQKEITVNGLNLIDHSGEFRLVRNLDTFDLNIQSSSINDTTEFTLFQVSSRKIDSIDRTEIIVEYLFRRGEPFSFHGKGNSQFVILDSLSGNVLFHSVNSSWHNYGTNYSQGFKSAGYSYDIKLNLDGTIELFNLNSTAGFKWKTESGKIASLPNHISDMKEGVYIFMEGEYVLKE